MSVSALQRRLIAVPLILLLGSGIFYSVSIAISDLYGYSPRQYLAHWQKKAQQPSPAQVDQALSGVDNAIRWNPRNAEFWNMQGLLNYYQAFNHYQQGDPSGYRQFTQQALADYQQATQLRPHWPHSWANLALMKAQLRQFDSEFQHALNQATTFGPWERDVNISVSEAGMRGWLQLDESTRTAVINNIERGLMRNNRVIKQRLSAINKLGLACLYLNPSKQRKRLCGA